MSISKLGKVLQISEGVNPPFSSFLMFFITFVFVVDVVFDLWVNCFIESLWDAQLHSCSLLSFIHAVFNTLHLYTFPVTKSSFKWVDFISKKASVK